GVRLGDAEGHPPAAVREARQPRPLLGVGAVFADDGAADGGRDHDQKQPGALRREFLLHQGQLVDPGSAAAVLFGQVHPEEPGLAGLVPQLGQRLAAAGARQHVVDVVVPRRQPRHRVAQLLLLVGLDEAHAESPACCAVSGVSVPCASAGSPTTARTSPTSTCRPASTCSAVTTPSAGAATVCSIFIASSHSSGCPAVTVSPSPAPSRITVPGMGAS